MTNSVSLYIDRQLPRLNLGWGTTTNKKGTRTVQVIWTPFGSATAVKCHPRFLITSPTSSVSTSLSRKANATTLAGAEPRTYKEGMDAVMAFAILRAQVTTGWQEAR